MGLFFEFFPKRAKLTKIVPHHTGIALLTQTGDWAGWVSSRTRAQTQLALEHGIQNCHLPEGRPGGWVGDEAVVSLPTSRGAGDNVDGGFRVPIWKPWVRT